MSEQDVQYTQNRFEDMFRRGHMPWTHHELEESIRRLPQNLLERTREPRILDVGCGNGWISLYLASKGMTVVGLDSSPSAIELAQTAATEQHLTSRVTFEVGNGLELPYGTEIFDAIVDRGFFHHVSEDEYGQYIAQMTRVLKPRGLFSLHAFSKRNPDTFRRRFAVEDIRRIFGEHFTLLEHDEDEWPIDAPAHLGHYLLEKI